MFPCPSIYWGNISNIFCTDRNSTPRLLWHLKVKLCSPYLRNRFSKSTGCTLLPFSLSSVCLLILSILQLNLIFTRSSRRWRRRTTKSSMNQRQQYNILFDLFQTVANPTHCIYIYILFYYRACLQSWLVQSLCIAFLKGSSVNSRDEQGKPISNFSNTVGCKIPRLPILRSRWVFALRCAGGGR